MPDNPKISAILETLTEAEANALFRAMKGKFGWMGVIFTTADIPKGNDPDTVLDSWAWENGEDYLSEKGNEYLAENFPEKPCSGCKQFEENCTCELKEDVCDYCGQDCEDNCDEAQAGGFPD